MDVSERPAVVIPTTCPHCGAPKMCCTQGRGRGATRHGEPVEGREGRGRGRACYRGRARRSGLALCRIVVGAAPVTCWPADPACPRAAPVRHGAQSSPADPAVLDAAHWKAGRTPRRTHGTDTRPGRSSCLRGPAQEPEDRRSGTADRCGREYLCALGWSVRPRALDHSRSRSSIPPYWSLPSGRAGVAHGAAW